MPSEPSVRKYVPMLYKEKIKDLRIKTENKHIWTSLDETTDTEQRYIANFIFGILDGTEEEKNKCYLLNIAQLKQVNASTIAAFYADSLQLLWPSGIQYNKVLLVVTDVASYMLSAMSALRVLYPKMLHLTCFAHGLRRIAEFVRTQFTLVNKLISTTKAVFVKAPYRKQTFKVMKPNVPLPPKPITTRWGTWLEAAEYYCNYLEDIKEVIEEVNENDSEAL